MIEFSERSRAIWFVTIPVIGADWLAHIEERESGGFTMLYRFRYYHDKKVWVSKDKKNWFIVESDKRDVAEAIEMGRFAAQAVALKGHGQVRELVRGTLTLKEFMDGFFAWPSTSAKMVTDPAEFERLTGKKASW